MFFLLKCISCHGCRVKHKKLLQNLSAYNIVYGFKNSLCSPRGGKMKFFSVNEQVRGRGGGG